MQKISGEIGLVTLAHRKDTSKHTLSYALDKQINACRIRKKQEEEIKKMEEKIRKEQEEKIKKMKEKKGTDTNQKYDYIPDVITDKEYEYTPNVIFEDENIRLRTIHCMLEILKKLFDQLEEEEKSLPHDDLIIYFFSAFVLSLKIVRSNERAFTLPYAQNVLSQYLEVDLNKLQETTSWMFNYLQGEFPIDPSPDIREAFRSSNINETVREKIVEKAKELGECMILRIFKDYESKFTFHLQSYTDLFKW